MIIFVGKFRIDWSKYVSMVGRWDERISKSSINPYDKVAQQGTTKKWLRKSLVSRACRVRNVH